MKPYHAVIQNICLSWKPNIVQSIIPNKNLCANKRVWIGSTNTKQSETLQYQSFEQSNQNTYFAQRPIVNPFQWIQKGDLVGDCSASNRGELALGKNMLVAYMPWEGFNFEDAVLINEKILPKYTSLHIEKYEVEIGKTPYGNETVTTKIPGVISKHLQKLDKNGIIKIGSWVREGDILVGKVVPTALKTLLTHEKLLYDIVGATTTNLKAKCLRVPQGVSGRVIRICFQNSNFQKTTPKKHQMWPRKQPISNVNCLIGGKYTVAQFSVMKLLGANPCLKNLKFRNSLLQCEHIFHCKQVGILSHLMAWSTTPIHTQSMGVMWKHNRIRIQPVQKQAFQSIGLSGSQNFRLRKLKFQKFTSNSNTGLKNNWPFISKPTSNFVTSLKTITLYIATKREFQVGDKISGRHGNKGIISQILPNWDMPYLANGCELDVVLNPLGVPSRMNVGQILECLLGFTGQIFQTQFKVLCFDEIFGYEASRSFIYSKLYEACQQTQQKWLFSKHKPGKFHLFDGRNGQLFHQSVLVGSTYLMKLIHLVDEKMHARATGPYSLITQQPLRGRAKQGGQRLGEMEVWALQGFGSAYILQELLTAKSDDLTGRTQIMQAVLNNTPFRFGTPESLRVVLRELQCLCLDLQVADADHI